MKIILNKDDSNKVEKLIETKEINIQVAEMLNDLCFDFNDSNKNLFKDSKNGLEVLIKKFELDVRNKTTSYIINRHLNQTITKDDLNKYQNNSYIKLIKHISFSINGYSLKTLRYAPYSFFPIDDISVDENDYYKEISHIGYFESEYNFLSLLHKNNIWMCITPNEINTMKPYINMSNGEVLTFGLGLGYFAFMCSIKKDVKNVTIVEKDHQIIDIFKKYLLPNFPNKDKIHIINEDAFDYIKNNNLSKYNFIFIDIWHNAEDGLPLYIEFMNQLNRYDNVYYWIEESLVCMYRRCLLTLFEEQLDGLTDNSYINANNDIDKIINDLYFKTKNITFKSFTDINNFLSKENIKKIIIK